MCGLCGMFDDGRRWLEAAAALDPAAVRRERLSRVALAREVLAPLRVTVDDWEGAHFILRGPTGKSEIVANLLDLWRAAEALSRRKLDPLTPLAPALGSHAGDGAPALSLRPPSTQRIAVANVAHAQPTPASTRLPVHVLTGFLGSGKTTLLNRLLRDPALADTAVLINEIGEISIDHHLVERMEEGDAFDVIVLRGGCTCCALRGDLAEALRELYARRADGTLAPFTRVVLETTGLADPAPIVFTLAGDPALRHKYETASVVTVVDALHGAAQLTRHPEARKQVGVADRLVLSKADLTGDAETDRLSSTLRRMNAAATIHDAHARHDVAYLLAPPSRDLTAPRIGEDAHALSSGRPSGKHSHDHSHREALPHSHAAEHSLDIETASFTLAEPIEWARFAIWLTLLLHAHGDRILRVKALLHVAGWPLPVVLDGVQHLVHAPTHLAAWPEGPRHSQLVFIAQNLDVSAIEPSLQRFLAGAQPRVREAAATVG